MFLQSFHNALLEYKISDARDEIYQSQFLELSNCSEAYTRNKTDRHFTGSAFIVDPSCTLALLTHHKKLGRWLQLGGHCDGVKDPFFVAWKEAYEESGLSLITPLSTQIMDLDIHSIPKYGDIDAHQHFDVRYAFIADPNAQYIVSDESHDLKWVPLEEIEPLTTSFRMKVMVDKTKLMFEENQV